MIKNIKDILCTQEIYDIYSACMFEPAFDKFKIKAEQMQKDSSVFAYGCFACGWCGLLPAREERRLASQRSDGNSTISKYAYTLYTRICFCTFGKKRRIFQAKSQKSPISLAKRAVFQYNKRCIILTYQNLRRKIL